MKLKTKVRAGKIRPNHNITVHRTVVSSFVTGRIAAQAAETGAIFAASTRERLQLCVRPPAAGAASQGARSWSEIIATPGAELHAAAAKKGEIL
jgi:hypothetical protein